MIFAAPIEVSSSLCSRSSVIEITSRIMTVGIRVRACRDRAGACFKQDDHDGNNGDDNDSDDGQHSTQRPQKPLDATP